jgi:hypothetical protein
MASAPAALPKRMVQSEWRRFRSTRDFALAIGCSPFHATRVLAAKRDAG